MAKTTGKQHDFNGAAQSVAKFRQPLERLTAALDSRRDLWQRLTPEQRASVEAIDPVLQLARQLHAELGGWFDA